MKRCPECSQTYEDQLQFCTRDGRSLIVPEDTPTLIARADTPNRSSDGDPMIGKVIAGRFRLLSKVGQGGMGAVYKAQHTRMNRVTAIKILTSELASNHEFIARFQREAEMASQIDHPNAVAIYDFGEAEDGIIYLAMEFENGRSLSSVLEQEGPLALDRVVSITRQAADALGAAHQLGILHRDFKPDNVMLCDKPNQRDWVKVVDFGIAKRAVGDPSEQGLTQIGTVLGTPLYMSPEQVAGEPLDPRSDLYSLALVTYQMLTAALPFDGSSVQSQMVKRLLEPPKPLRLARPQLELPPMVEGVVMRALARYPRDRFSSTREFADVLERAVCDYRLAQSQRQAPPPNQQPFFGNPAGPMLNAGNGAPPMAANPSNFPIPQPGPPQMPAPRPFAGPVSNPSLPFSAQPAPYAANPAAQYTVPAPQQNPYYAPQPVKLNHTGKRILFVILVVIFALMGACYVAVVLNEATK